MTATSQQIARQFELDKTTAQNEVRELRRKLASITNKGDESGDEDPPRKRNRVNLGDASENDRTTNDELLVTNAAHQFVILYSLWLRLGEATFMTELDPDWIEAERFENSDNKVQGQLRDIKKVLGDQLSSEMASETWIPRVVS